MDQLGTLVPLLAGPLGAVGVLLMVFIALRTGQLVVGSQQEKLLAYYEKALADRDKQIVDWKEVARQNDERADRAMQISTENTRALEGINRQLQQIIVTTEGRRTA